MRVHPGAVVGGAPRQEVHRQLLGGHGGDPSVRHHLPAGPLDHAEVALSRIIGMSSRWTQCPGVRPSCQGPVRSNHPALTALKLSNCALVADPPEGTTKVTREPDSGQPG